MKILHCVESYFPSVSGAPEVVRHLSERMVKAGHDVTVATRKLPGRKNLIHNGVKIKEFDIRPTSNRGMSTVTGIEGDIKEYQDFLINGKFDIIMTYAAQQWTTDLMFPVLEKIKSKTVLVPCGYSGLYDPEYTEYFNVLPKYLRKFSATVYLSEDYRDINFARRHSIHNTVVIPNGADEDEFTGLLSEEEKRFIRARYGLGGLIVCTIGNHTNEKGHAELLKCFKALPYPNATLVIAGSIRPHDGCYDLCELGADSCNNSKKFFGKRVVMVDGAIRSDIRKILQASDIFAFFSNVECSPLVLFESAAAGVPFVASSAGNNSEIAAWTKGGIIVDSHSRPNGRVSVNKKRALVSLTRLAYNKKLRNSLGRAGHENWKKSFTWKKLSEDYINLYESLLRSIN